MHFQFKSFYQLSELNYTSKNNARPLGGLDPNYELPYHRLVSIEPTPPPTVHSDAPRNTALYCTVHCTAVRFCSAARHPFPQLVRSHALHCTRRRHAPMPLPPHPASPPHTHFQPCRMSSRKANSHTYGSNKRLVVVSLRNSLAPKPDICRLSIQRKSNKQPLPSQL